MLEELFSWLTRRENQLLDLESEPLPDSIEVVEKLIEEHREFMESTAKRQTEVDTVCKVKQPTAPVGRKPSAKKTSTIRFAIKIIYHLTQYEITVKNKIKPIIYSLFSYSCMIVYIELIVF